MAEILGGRGRRALTLMERPEWLSPRDIAEVFGVGRTAEEESAVPQVFVGVGDAGGFKGYRVDAGEPVGGVHCSAHPLGDDGGVVVVLDAVGCQVGHFRTRGEAVNLDVASPR